MYLFIGLFFIYTRGYIFPTLVCTLSLLRIILGDLCATFLKWCIPTSINVSSSSSVFQSCLWYNWLFCWVLRCEIIAMSLLCLTSPHFSSSYRLPEYSLDHWPSTSLISPVTEEAPGSLTAVFFSLYLQRPKSLEISDATTPGLMPWEKVSFLLSRALSPRVNTGNLISLLGATMDLHTCVRKCGCECTQNNNTHSLKSQSSQLLASSV